MVLNSYFGLPLNGPDDIVWVTRGKKGYMLFIDIELPARYVPNTPLKLLPSAVWRLDPQEGALLQVVSRNHINANGIRVSPDPDQNTPYVTDMNFTIMYGPLADSWLGPLIYAYRLDDDSLPTYGRQFGLVREGIADGLHVDDKGKVWSGEYEGIVTRNEYGQVLGLFNG